MFLLQNMFLFQLNITALMGSQEQAKALLTLIDRGLEEVNLLDTRLANYDELLQVNSKYPLQFAV